MLSIPLVNSQLLVNCWCYEHRARVRTHALQQAEPVDVDTSFAASVLGMVLLQLSKEELLLVLELLRPT